MEKTRRVSVNKKDGDEKPEVLVEDFDEFCSEDDSFDIKGALNDVKEFAKKRPVLSAVLTGLAGYALGSMTERVRGKKK